MKATTEETILKKSVTVNAAASKVWNALTDPDLIRQYFFGTNVISEWKEGSPIVFRGEWEGKSYEDKGAILKIIPEKLFKFNYWSNLSGTEDIPENYADIAYELQEKNGKTILTVSQDGFRNKEAREHSEKSWEQVLNSMKELVEK